MKLILEEARKTSPDWFTVTLVGVYTGQRLRDCTDLEWAGVNFVDGTVTFKVYKKRGKKHSMPMHPILRRHLESMAGDTAEKYVAPSLAGRETGGRSGLSMEFSEIMQRAGVEAGQAERTGKRAMSSRSFHSLRHTLTSLMANGDVAPELRQRITGHDSERIHQQYTHHEQRSLARALSVIPDLTAD
ncbi:MAG TPA: tyrosine-type recombinase/integrase [Verrucomicrobiota bacterium]|nr:tyrosine-type recombinase/integrase [Verrucomicrobiota bacterium]